MPAPKSGDIGVVDYHAKSAAEIKEKNAGKSKAEKCKAARERDVINAEIKTYRKSVICFLLLQFAGLLLVLVGLVTSGWFVAYETPEQTTIAGQPIKRVHEWAFSFNGIQMTTEWCVDPEDPDTCTPDLDQFRYFKNEDNHSNLLWTGRYVPLAAQASAAGIYLLVGSIGSLGAQATVFAMGIMSYAKPINRNYLIAAFVIHVGFCAVNFTIAINFADGTSGIREELLKRCFIATLKPKLTAGFSIYLFFAGSVILSAASYFLFWIIPKLDDTVEGKLEKMRVRKVRREAYQDDLAGTTYMLEAVPEDTFDGTKSVGWTEEVVGAITNPLQGRELTRADVEDPNAVPPPNSIVEPSDTGTGPTVATPAGTRPTSPSSTRSSSRPNSPSGNGSRASSGKRPMSAHPRARTAEVRSEARTYSPTKLTRPGTAVGERKAKEGSPFAGRPQSAHITEGKEGLMSLEQFRTKQMMGMAKGARPLSALPGGMFAAQYGLEDESLTPRTLGIAPPPRLPPLPGTTAGDNDDDDGAPKSPVDRTMPCPDEWLAAKEARVCLPPGRPSSPVKQRTRPVSRVPKVQPERLRFDVGKDGGIHYDQERTKEKLLRGS